MTTRTQLTNASFPIILNGTEYLASILNDQDYSLIDEYIQSTIIHSARKAAASLKPSERGEMLQAAIRACAGVTWDTPEGARIMSTFSGVFRLGWIMVRKQHPKLTIEEWTELCNKDIPEAMSQIHVAYIKLHEIDKPEGEPPSEDGGNFR